MIRTTAHDFDPRYVHPLHEVRDADKLGRLVEAMAAGGWSGREVLAYRGGPGDAVLALTGSHRIAAARAAGLETIPVLVIEAETVEAYDAVREASRDQDWLAQVLAEDLEVETDALALIERELVETWT